MTAGSDLLLNSSIYVAGHRGLVGSALVRRLSVAGYRNLITRSHAELDLERESAVEDFFSLLKPEYVFLAAAKVGGIHANDTYPVDFLIRNLRIQNNVIESSWRHGVKGLLFLGSSCIYPREAPQPLREEYLLTGPLEPTNEPYAVAKIAGIKLCQAFNRQYGTRFISVMPTNLYGPNDNYHLENSHVLAAFIRKFHLAKLAVHGDWDEIQRDEVVYGPIPDEVVANLSAISGTAKNSVPESFACRAEGELRTDVKYRPGSLVLWGSGDPLREFLHSDDLADACIFLMGRSGEIFSDSKAAFGAQNLFNIGCGRDLSIRELALTVQRIVGFDGPVDWDRTKPDGTPRKLLDVSRLENMGRQSETTLEAGIRSTYQEYLSKYK